MNRELDRQIAINFHPRYTKVKTIDKEKGVIGSALAWDSISSLKDEFKLENGGSWSYCKDDIWATEHLPHYSEDLNLAFTLPIPCLWEFQIETLARGKTYKAMYYLDRDDGFDYASAIHLNPAEAICLARLKLKDDYGI